MMAAQSVDRTLSVHGFEGLRGSLRENEAMSRHTSWRVGGPADLYFVPEDVADLIVFLRQLPDVVDVVWTGLGSNLLVRDGGIRGVVVATQKGLNNLTLIDEHLVQAEAGVTGAKLARFSVAQELTGAEFMAGIPGTVGGALAMNAGAWGSETWSIVADVDTIDRKGVIRTRGSADFQIAYREVHAAADETFLAARFRLDKDARGGGGERIKNLLDERSAAQPVQSANAGSVFRNPKDDYAARLIEISGLKDRRLGGARVSEKHANFIINDGQATARDIEALISLIQETVERQHNVRLIHEVRMIGEAVE